MRRVWLILLPLLVSLGLLVAGYFYLKPKVQTWLSAQIQTFSQEKLPVEIRIGQLDWEILFIPKVILKDVKISSKPGFEDFPSISLTEAIGRLDVLYLFTGQLLLSSLEISGLSSEINLDPFLKDKSPSKRLPLDVLFKTLEKVPLKRLELNKTQITLLSPETLAMSFDLQDADLQIVNQKNRLLVDLKLNTNLLKLKSQIEIPFAFEAEFSLNPKSLEIEYAKIQSQTSSLSVEGSLDDFANVTLDPQLNLSVNATGDLDRIEKALSQFKKMPDLRGTVQVKGRASKTSHSPLQAGAQLTTDKIGINQFEIGNIETLFELQDHILKTPEIRISSAVGLLDIQDLQLSLNKDTTFPIQMKAKIETEMIDLNQLMINLGVGDIPMELFIGGGLNCSGVLDKKPDVHCSGELHADELEVRTGESAKETIVRVANFKVAGDVNITDKAVSYKTNIALGENTGTSSGEISYDEGFNIQYASPALDFKKITYLAGLKLEGVSAVSGFTKGDSNAAVFQLMLNGKDIGFEDFVLGSVQTQLRYKSGTLFFEDMQGQIDKTKYFAEIEVDLNKSRIKAEAQAPQFEVTDLLKALQRKLEAPVEMLGQGSLQVSAEGPFSLGEMSYTLLSQIRNGRVAGEKFDLLNLQLFSKNGEVAVRDGLIKKASVSAEFSGTANPHGILDIKAKTIGFPLELSQAVSNWAPNLYGELDLDLHLTGQILNPTVNLNGAVKNITIDEKTIPSSTFNVDFSRAAMKGTSSIMNGQLDSTFNIPFEEGPFALSLQAKNWNFTSLFLLTGAASLITNYDSSLTGQMELKSDSGGFFNASGWGKIQTLFLQRDDLRIQNPQIMEMTATDGVYKLNHFSMLGPSTEIEILGQNITAENLGFSISANTDLRLFQIFLPFLDELAGKAVADVKVSGSWRRPEVLGLAKVSNGFVKIRDFPHAFERIEGEAQFSQYRVNITRIKASLGGGIVSGQGQIRIEGVRNIPTDIRARLVGGTFNVPDRIRSSGDLDIAITGNWFPFTLSGSYQVKQGFVDKEFTEVGGPLSLKQSSYLPKVILQNSFEPILLDLDVNIERNIQVKNKLLDGAMIGRVNIKGPPSNPIILGKLSADKNTKLFFNEKPFEVITMNVDFKDASEINPELFVSARSRVNEFDINLVVQGSAKDPKIRLSSLPPLADNDIISLLALGVTQGGLEKQVDRLNQQSNQSSALGQSAIENAFGAAIGNVGIVKDIQKRTGVALQFSSAYDDTKNVNVQKITASKKITDRLKVSASQLQGGKSSVEGKIEYQLNQSVSAVGSFERREPDESTSIQNDQRKSESIFGLDLEFRQEFK